MRVTKRSRATGPPSPSQGRSRRLVALVGLAVILSGVWATTSPAARRYRLARTSTVALRDQAQARPDDAMLQLALARRLAQEGVPAEAVLVLQRAVDLGSGSPEVLAALGEALARAGQDEEAFSYLRLASVQAPRADALRALGGLYLKHHRPDKALPELERAVRLEPESTEGWQLLALARRRESNWTETAAALRRAVALSPNDPELRLALGEALLELGQLDAAEPELRRARDARADSSSADTRSRVHTLLGRLHLSRTPLAEHAAAAEVELRRALELQPKRVSARFALADLLLRRGRVAEAERELREVLSQDPTIVQARFRRAQALRRLGRRADAEQEMVRFHRAYERQHLEMQLRGRLTLRPNDPSLRARLDRLLKGTRTDRVTR